LKQVTVEPQKSSTLLPPHIIKATGASRAKSDSQVCRTQRVSRRVLWPDDCLSPQRLVCTFPCLRGPPCLTAPLPLGRTRCACAGVLCVVWCAYLQSPLMSAYLQSPLMSAYLQSPLTIRVWRHMPASRVPCMYGVVCASLWCVHLCGARSIGMQVWCHVCICVVPDP